MASGWRTGVAGTALVAATAFACRRPSAGAADAGRVRVAAAPVVRADAAAEAGGARVTSFSPRWACRITGPGRAGRGPRVAVPALRPHAEPGTIVDRVTLRDGRTLTRANVVEGGRAVLDRAEVTLRDARDAGVGTRVYGVIPGAVEMLFEDARGAGVAFLDGARIMALRIGGEGTETLVESAGDVTRPCHGPVTDPLRLWPVAPVPWPFPPVSGMPPSVADARWTLSRDARGVCIARLEGDGPWGRALLEAGDAGVRGELSLAESLNPVACGPVGPE
jgi:hypothetical protein